MIKFIADIGSNHNQDYDRIKKLTEKAKEAGVDSVKFQYFKAEKLYSPEKTKEIELARERELSDFLLDNILKDKKIKMPIGITPFDSESLKNLYFYNEKIEFIKISSFDALRPLFINEVLYYCIDFKKELHISLGCLNYLERKEFLKTLRDKLHYTDNIPPITLYHCISEYPALSEECDMMQIKLLEIECGRSVHFNTLMGWSDHTVDVAAIFAALKCGATTIEFHFDLDDMSGAESNCGHVWNFSKAKEMIELVKKYEESMSMEQHILTEKAEAAKKIMADPVDGLRPPKEFR